MPLSDKPVKLTPGDYEVMTSRILPSLREIFDIFEIITLVGWLR